MNRAVILVESAEQDRDDVQSISFKSPEGKEYRIDYESVVKLARAANLI